jgi:transcriptional regulator
MNRRDLLLGLAVAGWEANAQDSPSESLYIPKPQLIEDRQFLHDFIDEFAFADLITASPGIRITHIPVLLDRAGARYGTVSGHVSRLNPQSQVLAGREPAVIVFRGPHSYISPTWYGRPEVVPTWNFAVVHASGRPRAITGRDAIHGLLARLIHKFEGADAPYDFAKLPESYTSSLITSVIGFEMEIERLEGKFKLGQERSEAVRKAILKNLRAAQPARSMYEFTSAFYKRLG